MKSTTVMWSIVVLLALNSCFPVSNTKIYEKHPLALPRFIAVLPFVNQTNTEGLDNQTLLSFQEKLADELRALGQFDKVTIPGEREEINAKAIVECTITQFDLGARRVVVKTEVTQPETSVLLRRMVTQSHLVSVVWPLDYVGALNRSASEVISDIAESLSK